MAELKSFRSLASAPTAMCLKKMLQFRKNLTMALEKERLSFACAMTMAMQWDAVTTKFEKLRSSVEQCVNFANKAMARQETEVVTMT